MSVKKAKPGRTTRERAERIREKIQGVRAGVLPPGFQDRVRDALRRKTNAGREKALDRVEHDITVHKILTGSLKRPV